VWSKTREVEGEQFMLVSLKGETLEEALGLTINRNAYLKAHRVALAHPRPKLKRGTLGWNEIEPP
jgi:hypothetical protein